MRCTTYLLLTALLTLAAPSDSWAQSVFTGLNYQVSFPFSDTKDFTKDVSFRGVGVDFRKMVKPNLSFGLSANWNVFHSTSDEMISLRNLGQRQAAADISGRQNRITNSFPILLNLHYYLIGSNDSRVPFVGFGAGASYIESRLEIGTFAVTEDNWHFTLAPEVGIGIQASYDIYVVLSAKYNYAFKADGVQHSYLGVSIGLFYF